MRRHLSHDVPSEDFTVTPTKFYAVVDLIQGMDENRRSELKGFVDGAGKAIRHLDDECESLAQANNDLMQERRINTKLQKKSWEQLEKDWLDHRGDSDTHFLRIAFEIVRILQEGNHLLLSIANDLRPRDLLLSGEHKNKDLKPVERMNLMVTEFEMNGGNVNRYIRGLQHLDATKYALLTIADGATKILDQYYKVLLHRHSVEGVEIFTDAIVTDVALTIFENVDSHGEIADGKDPDELSAYTLHKAEIIASALKSGLPAKFIQEKGAFIKYVQQNLQFIWDTSDKLENMFKNDIESVKNILDMQSALFKIDIKPEFNSKVRRLDDLDPRTVVYKDKKLIATAEERFKKQFQNETLRAIVAHLSNQDPSAKDLIGYILARKKELRDFYRDENSFYVCKMGAGNAFSGEAPGALRVVPGQRPQATLDEIVGSGFADVKDFIKNIEASAQWHDLFLATSPSRTTDKSNVLLVGPPGCGKTEILRAVGGDKKSIGIFAQGSDFLTCWMGEAQKNPKRLFEEGLKLQKESGKHVHFLIDEIDAVLKRQDLTSHGETNLTLEFQILMDGVVHYPNLSVWGTTNSPERIPMAMIRRFSKVLIVGELSQEDRIKLLQHFVGNFLPVSTFNDVAWAAAAKKLDGATGDVMRKVADHIWRTKMSWFVTHHPETAKELVSMLNANEKFTVAKFDDKERFSFKQRLQKKVSVEPDDLMRSIDMHLKNIAVRNEIDVAKKTYESARKFLNQVNNGEV